MTKRCVAHTPLTLSCSLRSGHSSRSRAIGFSSRLDDGDLINAASLARDNQDETPYCLIEICSRTPTHASVVKTGRCRRRRAVVLSGTAAPDGGAHRRRQGWPLGEVATTSDVDRQHLEGGEHDAMLRASRMGERRCETLGTGPPR